MQQTLPVSRIRQGKNPREYFDPVEMAELEDGIRVYGVLQPILVRPVPGTGLFEIIAGERRWRAAKNVFGDDYAMPVLVKDFDDGDAEVAALIENVQRADMITKSRIGEAYPAWALSWKLQTLRAAELTQVAEDGKDAYASDIASLVLELARMRMQDAFRPEIEGEFIGFGAVLSWCEDDLTVRIYDDLINMAHEGEFCDLIGEICFDLNATNAMRTWQRQMRQRFKAMRLIDRLIWRLSEGH